ncbi:MAG TPA: hypothetical protein VLK84_14130 [Longimicrobium sp.]|nr:hypothetical protein [Longimicrobium sp.]
MKYDDASWHSGGDFPADSPEELGGTHIALILKWCFIKGWAGEVHREDSADDLDRMLRGELSATDYFFMWCDGKFTDEDLNAEGNAFMRACYHACVSDYEREFAREMYVVDEAAHDFNRFSEMMETRYRSSTASPPAATEAVRPDKGARSDGKGPWWKVW